MWTPGIKFSTKQQSYLENRCSFLVCYALSKEKVIWNETGKPKVVGNADGKSLKTRTSNGHIKNNSFFQKPRKFS